MMLLNETLEERAAIAEFDGGQSRAVAEKIAGLAPLVMHPFQNTAIQTVFSALRSVNRIVLYLPTGAGKTILAVKIIHLGVQKSRRILFVCNRIELVNQTSEKFYKYDITHGILQGQNTRTMYASVIVASIQTIDRRPEILEDFDLLIVDEAHGCAGSLAYHRLFARFKDKKIVGLTATPFARGMAKHHDAIGGPLFEDMVIGETISGLIASGHLVDCDIYGPTEPDLSGVPIVAGDYHQEKLEEAVDKPQLVGDIVTHKLRLARGQQAIVFATGIAHSKHIVEEFRARGITAEHIDAYTPEIERKRIVQGFKRGLTEILSNVGVLAEGFDAPAVSVMILARPTRSLIRYIQMAGRVLRTHPGKTKALIIDHSGTCHRLGYPTENLPLVLDDGKPIEGKAQDKKEPEAKLCTSCQYLKPPKVTTCPQCGFKPERQSEVETEDGDLQKVTRRKGKDFSAADKARFYAELMWYGKQKGYRPSYALAAFRERFQAWPYNYRSITPATPTLDTLNWIKSRNIARAKSTRRTPQ